MKQDKTWAPITQYGGAVMKIVPKKKRLDYAVLGSDAGELKLAALAALETTQLDEAGLLELIRASLPPSSAGGGTAAATGGGAGVTTGGAFAGPVAALDV